MTPPIAPAAATVSANCTRGDAPDRGAETRGACQGGGRELGHGREGKPDDHEKQKPVSNQSHSAYSIGNVENLCNPCG
jgi:hypothetical protein